MDKNKVIEYIENAISSIDWYDYANEKREDLDIAFKYLNQALKELKKPDWISVEDELPPYGECVFVKSEESSTITLTYCFSSDGDDGKLYPFRDNNDFLLNSCIHGNITHWCKMDKLEV